MESFESFKQSLLSYLYTEQHLEKRDIERIKLLSREEKIESGLLIANLSIAKTDNQSYILDAPNNYSKLRSGDKVVLKKIGEDSSTNAIVVDTNTNTITVAIDKTIDKEAHYDLEITSPNLLSSLIGCLEGIVPATPGASFLRMLSGEENVEAEDFLELEPETIDGFEKVFSSLNTEQQIAIRSMLKFYPIHVLQGPPGTGKTQVLAATAIAASLKNREVVIISNTHQAVNNSLQKIHSIDKKIPLFKIGELLKAEDLSEDIHKFQKFAEYNDYSRENRRKKKYGYVIGMTIWGAITHLGLRKHSHFRPYIALVDEASLMPLTYSSILGKCASSICFFGDSRQMPPIFRTELNTNTLSISILDYCSTKVKGVPVCVLPETHRMNNEITSIISKSFYEPYGIKLFSAKEVAEKQYHSSYLERLGKKNSIIFMNESYSTPMRKEENEGEANAVIDMLKNLLEEGHHPNDIAIVTPFRKQVRLLREKAHERLAEKTAVLIDTVERIQGQDVNCIILSFASSDDNYIREMNAFLFNPNRLNVMISRAKQQVIIFGSKEVQRILRSILTITVN